MEENNDSFLAEIDSLVTYLDKLPIEITQNTETKITLDYTKRMLVMQRDQLKLTYNDFHDYCQKFKRDCEDSNYTSDVAIVTNGSALERTTKSMINRYNILLDEVVKLIQDILKLWRNTIETERIQEIADTSVASEENPFDAAVTEAKAIAAEEIPPELRN